QMSHEIRTPINAVIGMNEMILRESDDDDIIDYANNINSAGRTLLSLINSILDFSKIEDGKMELIPVKYDLSSMINDLVNSISQRAANKNLKFEVDVDKNMPCALYGDDVRIRQVIMNLLTNAVKYTETGTVKLIIRENSRNGSSITMYVSVKDTGIGIKEEDMGKLFESFERIEETRNRNIEGTGLGMSIVTKLLAMMNSKLEVESVYGSGSKFSFELVQEIINDEPIGDFNTRLKISGEKGKEEYLVAEGARVLVVDDNEMNRKVVKSLMKRNGIIPDMASSGMEAINMISGNKYDIVFLDHMMPKMDGIETLTKLKEQELINEDSVVIALTANAVSGARDKYLEAGFNDYLSKPIEVVQLEKKLYDWLPKDMTRWVTGDEANKKKDKKGKNEIEVNEDSDLVFDFIPEEGDETMDSENEKSVMSEDLVNNLKKLGFDVDTAMEYCYGDDDFYKELLTDYASSYQKKKNDLDEFYKKEEWGDFEILIHALKSTSKTVGVMSLYEKALALEQAANRKDGNFIHDKYPEFNKDYEALITELENIL
nr:response regulator [Lachnospiraceae bacterium]